MRNSIAHGRSVALRMVALQLTATGLLAFALSLHGMRSALAAAVGGAAVALGNALFALRLFGAGPAPVRRPLQAAYVAEALKWAWLVAVLYLAIAVWRLDFLPLIAGVLLAQFAFWLALVVFR
ncbi:MAG: ATP synthase subunit I [Xanthomonadaceae bacterium]|nr:ATP synthase subunit I [Xanthomonadaceae bacterium]MDE1958028.1 ATP synthase subunit I [Xanthomonadaceae bacterium]MDE2177950.1 ATP synthase subunit I [Xanthomonadaceae bacterium]MDE2246057.1 ATP synthase subunit I [Xanthomonadaceae bacterium]